MTGPGRFRVWVNGDRLVCGDRPGPATHDLNRLPAVVLVGDPEVSAAARRALADWFSTAHAPAKCGHPDGPRYLGAECVFCKRAGYSPAACLWHAGRYRYGWEDAVG